RGRSSQGPRPSRHDEGAGGAAGIAWGSPCPSDRASTGRAGPSAGSTRPHALRPVPRRACPRRLAVAERRPSSRRQEPSKLTAGAALGGVFDAVPAGWASSSASALALLVGALGALARLLWGRPP